MKTIQMQYGNDNYLRLNQFEQVIAPMINPAGTFTTEWTLSAFKRGESHPIILYFPKQETTVQEESISIEDIIAQYTSTHEGKQLWQKVDDKFREELYGDVLSGKISKIKYYRIINNMDQKTLCKLTGLKQPNISRIEQVGYLASTKTYKILAKVFGVDYKELLP